MNQLDDLLDEMQRAALLRDKLASFAMMGILAGVNPTGPWPEPLWLAEKAYQYADAMLREGQKGKP